MPGKRLQFYEETWQAIEAVARQTDKASGARHPALGTLIDLSAVLGVLTRGLPFPQEPNALTIRCIIGVGRGDRRCFS